MLRNLRKKSDTCQRFVLERLISERTGVDDVITIQHAFLEREKVEMQKEEHRSIRSGLPRIIKRRKESTLRLLQCLCLNAEMGTLNTFSFCREFSRHNSDPLSFMDSEKMLTQKEEAVFGCASLYLHLNESIIFSKLRQDWVNLITL